MKDKEDFLQKVVKARNNLQEDNSNLKKRNIDLVRDNNSLSEKVAQLDEDTDTGVELLRNSNARETVLKRVLDEYKTKEVVYKEKQSELIKANEDLKAKVAFIKDKYEKSIRENQEYSALKNIKLRKLEDEILVLTNIPKQAELENKMEKLNVANDEIERKLKEKALYIDTLEVENNLLKQKNNDLVDELFIKNEIEKAEEEASLKISHSSLKEELSQLNVIACDSNMEYWASV